MKIILKPVIIHLLIIIYLTVSVLWYTLMCIFYFLWNLKVLKWNNFMYYEDNEIDLTIPSYKIIQVYDQNMLETYRRWYKNLDEL